MTTIYNKATGKPVEVAHAIDLKEYIAGGAFTYEKPVEKPVVPKAKPAVIPTVADKKPVAVPTPIAKKPERKISPKIIRK